jgi:ubiquinone/menaquinone biosynthesis C-methylase UbiE
LQKFRKEYKLGDLEFAKRQIKKADVQNKVKGIVEGSITDLSKFIANTFDAVICLGGPLSHVEGKKNRDKAVSELIRVAKGMRQFLFLYLVSLVV